MADNKPVILIVDDERPVLNAVDRDLRQKYGQNYRFLKADSGETALKAVEQLKQRGDEIALFVSDQRMPGMSGVEFLERALEFFPEARRVLLTAYADTQAAIDAINRVGVEYYFLKPWDPPEENLYPVITDLLDEWRDRPKEPPPYTGLRVAGTLWSRSTHEVKDFLTRHQISYRFLDVESDPEAREAVERACQGEIRLPTVFLASETPDDPQASRVLIEPSIETLAEVLGLRTRAELPFYDLVIIGGGPAGLAAAVYGSSDGLRVLLIERQAPGGQAGNSPKIENYMGFPGGLSGSDLARRAVTQARRFGVEIVTARSCTKVQVDGPRRTVTLSDGSEVAAEVVLIATGASFRMLDVPGAAELTGAGVYYGAAHTEAMYYVDQDVYVIGGANSAGQGAMFLSRYARHVTLLVRGRECTASKYLVDAMYANAKITVCLNTDIVEIHGRERVEAIVTRNRETGVAETRPAAAVFVFIGARPQSDMVADVVKLDERGAILTGPDLLVHGKPPAEWPLERNPFMLETSVPGIFAAGDVRHGANNRVASAAGEGGLAVALTWQYKKTIGQ
jgi:thioredoxin reductase (NADPH)